jgi:outer membrane protein assembly factor BamD
VLRFLSLSVLLVTLVLVGCAIEEKDKTLKLKPEEIYEEARDNLNGNLYDKAIALYDKLEGRAAGTVLAQQAQLDKAYAQYKNGDRATAIVTLDRFIKLNPASPALDYALYLKGTVNFNDDLGLLSKWFKQDLAERDQMAARESFEAYKELVTRFPNSSYTPDATLRMRHIVNLLAQSEIKVARHYYKKGAYVAAINRAQTTLNDYQNIAAVEEALIILIDSYDALGLTKLKDDTIRVLQASYPQSHYFTDKAPPPPAPTKSWYQFW